MQTFFEVAYNIILPIFLVVGASFIVDRRLDIDLRALSRLIIYLLTPAFIVDRVASTQVNAAEASRLVALALLVSFGMALVAWVVARLLGYDQRLESAFVLSAVMINAGNYGLPLNRFAFGAAGEERALVFFVTTLVVSYTLGVFLASRGRLPARRALLNMFRVPLPYAAAIGLLINAGDVDLPVPVGRALGLLSAATIPAMLIVLGSQLARASVRGRLQPILVASGLRLIVSPLLAAGFALLLGVTGLTRSVAITEAAMPVAVASGVLAVEFGADADFVTATILFSTVASMFTLAVLLAVIG